MVWISGWFCGLIFGVSVMAEFQFHGGCWRRWVCHGGAVAGLVVLGYLGLL